MSMNVLLPIIPGSLPSGYCFTSFQQLLVDFADNMQALLQGGQSFFNFGSTKPAPEFQGYPWLNTNDGRWYWFSGSWIAPMNHDPNERRLFIGTTTDLLTYDGGNTNPPSPTGGPSWTVDTDFADRVPIGPGTLAVNPGDNVGASTHTLTEAEGATGQHIHPFGKSNNAAGPAGDDAYFRQLPMQTVPSYSGTYITGSNGVIVSTLTESDLFTLPAGNTGAGNTPTPFSIVQQSRGIYIIKPVATRLYYVVP